jgi:hypothetical protein
MCLDTDDFCTATTIQVTEEETGCPGYAAASTGYYNHGGFKRHVTSGVFDSACTICACLVADTIITLEDGTTKLIQDIQFNDVLKSLDVAGMPQQSNEWHSWSSDTLNYTDSTSTVINFTSYDAESVTSINNGRLIATDSHNHVVNQEGIWYIRTTSELNVGNMLLDMDNSEFEITSLVKINELTTVYSIDVNNSNLYFANNVLTHNK